MFTKDDIKSLIYAGLIVVAFYGAMYGFYHFSKWLGIYEQFKI
jgi:hypothetical protein